MFEYASISLTEIETAYVFIAVQTSIIGPDVNLLFTDDIIKQGHGL